MILMRAVIPHTWMWQGDVDHLLSCPIEKRKHHRSCWARPRGQRCPGRVHKGVASAGS